MSSAVVEFSRRVPEYLVNHPDPVVNFSMRVPAPSQLRLDVEREQREERLRDGH